MLELFYFLKDGLLFGAVVALGTGIIFSILFVVAMVVSVPISLISKACGKDGGNTVASYALSFFLDNPKISYGACVYLCLAFLEIEAPIGEITLSVLKENALDIFLSPAIGAFSSILGACFFVAVIQGVIYCFERLLKNYVDFKKSPYDDFSKSRASKWILAVFACCLYVVIAEVSI